MKGLHGIYLVIDPCMEREKLLSRLAEALEAGIHLLQIWNHWPPATTQEDKLQLAAEILQLARPHEVPVLINEDWQLCVAGQLQGVHFDAVPQNWEEVRKQLPATAIIGFTAGNNLERIRWADAHKIDYLSFCAMFPSASAGDCEIVSADTVLQAREITSLPLFLSGGIHPGNLNKLADLDFQGVAIISGVMSAPSPSESIREYKNELRKLKKLG